jgi:hypothetical protein
VTSPESSAENGLTVVDVGVGLPEAGELLDDDTAAAFVPGVGLLTRTDARCEKGVDGELEAPAGFVPGVGLLTRTDARCEKGVDADEVAGAGVVVGVMRVFVTAPATVKVSVATRESKAT